MASWESDQLVVADLRGDFDGGLRVTEVGFRSRRQGAACRSGLNGERDLSRASARDAAEPFGIGHGVALGQGEAMWNELEEVVGSACEVGRQWGRAERFKGKCPPERVLDGDAR